MLRDAGFLLLVASNQPAAAKAKATREQLGEVHDRVVSLLAAGGVTIDDWRYCLHHPQATVPELRGDPCGCRKPAPGMLLELAAGARGRPRGQLDGRRQRRRYRCGIAAGCRTALVAAPGLRAPPNRPSGTCRIGTQPFSRSRPHLFMMRRSPRLRGQRGST